MRRFTLLIVLSLAGLVHADLTVYSGDSAQEALWQAAAGGSVPLENFENYVGVGGPGIGGDALAALPSIHVIFDPIVPGVYDDGQWAHSGTKQWSNWAGGAGNSSSHVLRPEVGRPIFALGFWNCNPQGDQPMEVYDATDQLVGTISGHINDHNSDPTHSMGFAGFISTIPIAYVRIPGSLGDGWNHFDDLQVVTQLATTADYNHNALVDAADYIVWRKTFGQSGIGLAAEGGNTGASAGVVDQADYAFWKSHFGQPASSGLGATANAAVPEPATLAMIITATLVLGVRRLACVINPYVFRKCDLTTVSWTDATEVRHALVHFLSSLGTRIAITTKGGKNGFRRSVSVSIGCTRRVNTHRRGDKHSRASWLQRREVWWTTALFCEG